MRFGFNVALDDPIVQLALLGTDGNGEGSFFATVPNSAAFVGLTGHVQAVTSQPGAIVRLSNPVSVTVVP